MTARTKRARGDEGTTRARWALAALLLSFAAGVARADPPPAADPAPTAAELPLVERARAVLQAFCEDCRAAHEHGGTLDMDALARDRRLIVPRLPDASPAYQRLFAVLRRDRAPEAKDDARTNGNKAAAKSNGAKSNGTAEATVAEPRALTYAGIASVRDWIDQLEDANAACEGREPLTTPVVKDLTSGWTRIVGAAEAADTRFVSLAHLWNTCLPALRLVAYRAAAGPLLAALAPGKGKRPDFETLGDASAILAVRPSEIGITAAAWDELTKDAPAGLAGVVPLDWLAASISKRAQDSKRAQAQGRDGAQVDANAERHIADLARFWAGDVDLARAAAEQGVSAEELAAKLVAVPPHGDLPAQRLLHGLLSREEWDGLARALETGHSDSTDERRSPENGIDLVLWTDKLGYRPRDLVEIYVSVSKACHLTVIDIDQDGKAVVLFPNEIEPDNLVPPRVPVRIPGKDAAYQLRFDRAGAETLVAICQRNDVTPEGIFYDYEKQRFAALGDWRTFLTKIPELQKEIRERETRQQSRRRRGRSEPPKQPDKTVVAEDDLSEGRAAIRVQIEPRATP